MRLRQPTLELSLKICVSGSALRGRCQPVRFAKCSASARNQRHPGVSALSIAFTLTLSTALAGLALPAAAAPAMEYITGVRINAPTNLVVGQPIPVEVGFTDASGTVVAPEPGRTVAVAPAALYPCLVAQCTNSDYSESFVTQPGQALYTIYVRSLVEGFNAVRVTHPNGSTAQAVFTSLSAGGGSGGSGGAGSAPPPTSSAPLASSSTATASAGTPSQFQLANGIPSMQLGSCTAVRVTLRDSSGNLAPLSGQRSIALNPGGGIHPSLDQCASYRNDPIILQPGDTDFTFYAYVISNYTGLGRVTLNASGIEELQIPFTVAGAAGSSTPTPPVAAAPTPTPTPTPVAPAAPAAPAPVPTQPSTGSVSVWVNDGAEKIIQEETRSFNGSTSNALWDGTTVRTFGARNEVVSFNVIVDNRGADLNEVRVDFDRLQNGGYVLATTNSSQATVFDWRTRPIEVFTVGYMEIHGLSRIAYELYDETHTPESFRRPYVDHQPRGPAIGSGSWFDRPHHNKSYPDIAIPQEVQPQTVVRSGNSQGFWVDVYIPKDAPAGRLTGTVRVTNGGAAIANLPVEINVADFTLSDESAAKSMVFLGDTDLSERYFTGPGGAGTLPRSSYADYRKVVDRHFMLAWRHRISLIDGNALVAFSTTPIDAPNEDWQKRLRGVLYTANNGFAGPGQNLPHDVFSIGTYSNYIRWWDLQGYDPTNSFYDPNLPRQNLVNTLRTRTDQWENWFRNNAPGVKRFLYADDEPTFTRSRDPNFPTIEFANLVSETVAENPGPGGDLPTLITASPLGHDDELPHTNFLGDVIAHGITEEWEAATAAINSDPDREYFMYNGRRPASGTFVIDDDGVALRELPWGQYKKGITRWFYWNSTYYNNFQGGPPTRNLIDVGPNAPNYRRGSHTNVFQSAQTFGGHTHFDPSIGETGWNYSNGDGVLLYPGTDQVFPEESRGLLGPIASLRLKHWRRGVQDVCYIEQAMARDANATQAIINEMVPEVMWELGVANPNDPTYVHKPPSWSNDPDVWEEARRRLGNIILGYEAL